MPIVIHQAPSSWLIKQLLQWGMSGLLPANFIHHVEVLPSPLIENFLGRFAGSKREPDCTVWPNGRLFPSIVLETSFSELLPMVMADQKIWSEGTNYAVSITILVKISQPNAEGVVGARCIMTMYDSSGPTSVFSETLFPRLQTSLQHIPITMLQLYRETLPQGIRPDRQVYLDLDALRLSLEGILLKRGLFV